MAYWGGHRTVILSAPTLAGSPLVIRRWLPHKQPPLRVPAPGGSALRNVMDRPFAAPAFRQARLRVTASSCHSESFALCHSEQSEQSAAAQDKLREESDAVTQLQRPAAGLCRAIAA